MMRRNRGLYADSGGKDIEAGPGGGRENARVDGLVQVKHQARDESDRHATSESAQAASGDI